MENKLAYSVALALGVATASSHAVVLNPRGTGQLLIYPYYTVNHQQTLLSVVNTTEHGKALRVRFREGYDGREVAGFNVYLGPFDSWVGAVYDTSADGSGAAAIATNDHSCTVPAFAAPFGEGGPRALTFSNANYSQGVYGTPTGTDHGPTGLARTREGFFEIIEMGEVNNAEMGTLTAITPVNGTPPGCAQVQAAWQGAGYWSADATTDLLPPAGGLFGSAGIVDVAQGTLYAYDATAIEGFSDVAQHTAPGDPKPNLSTAVTDSAHDIATAWVPSGNAMVKADYPATTRGIDAVSAVLMSESMHAEFNVEPELGASTDWLLAFPTKQFYVDPALIPPSGDPLKPFESSFDGDACVTVEPEFVDREGFEQADSFTCGLPPTTVNGNYLCYETQVAPIGPLGTTSRALASHVLTPLFPGGHCFAEDLTIQSGNVKMRFFDGLRPSLQGMELLGLPAIGFAATNYINANVTAGVLSNYSAAYPSQSTAGCVNSTSANQVCE